MTQQQKDEDFKIRIQKKFGFDNQKANAIVEAFDNMDKLENQKEMPEITPELEAKLLALVGQ